MQVKRRQMRDSPESVRFDKMTPIVKEPFTPDDDAIVATNALWGLNRKRYNYDPLKSIG